MNPFGAEFVSHEDGLLVGHGQNLRTAWFVDNATLHALIPDLAKGNLSRDGQAIAIRRPPMVIPYYARAELVDGETKSRIIIFSRIPKSYSVYRWRSQDRSLIYSFQGPSCWANRIHTNARYSYRGPRADFVYSSQLILKQIFFNPEPAGRLHS